MSDTSIKNKEAVAVLFKEHADYLYNFAINRVSDVQLAEDLVQDTFVSALKNYDSFRGKSKATTWLIAILKNKIIDHYRKKVREYHTESIDTLAYLDEHFDDKGHWQMGSVPHPWKYDTPENIDQSEFYRILQKCLARLKEIQRIAFVMKHLDETETDEICKELNITASNYWVIIHRAKLQLRACLEKYWIKA